jgi:thymidylate synthase
MSSHHEEEQYLDIVRRLTEGVELDEYGKIASCPPSVGPRVTRGGAITVGTFCEKMQFSLGDGRLPLLTTKRVFFRGVVEELLWMIRGSTDARELADRGVHIWDAHSSREFLDGRGLTDYEEGEVGPLYGWQWRNAGGDYSKRRERQATGVDQLAQVIESLRDRPGDRRHVICAWNPPDIPRMALPPCHCLVQFYVRDGHLDCTLYQRSADVGLGVPFNIASYALLTRLIAACVGIRAGVFNHILGDCHIYEPHIAPLRQQATLSPFPFPRLTIRGEESLRTVEDLERLTWDDFELHDYKCHKSIKMDLVV